MVRDIGEWLEGLGLGKYADAFAENDVEFRALLHLGEDDLKELGVSLGHRSRVGNSSAGRVAFPRGKPHRQHTCANSSRERHGLRRSLRRPARGSVPTG